MEKSIIITGASGFIGKHVAGHFADRGFDVLELSRSKGHDLTDESFVKEWFSANRAEHLINLFAYNDHVDNGRMQVEETLFDISLESFRDYLDVNLTALFSVCREFARNNQRGRIVNFSSIYGIVSPAPNMYGNSEKHIGYGVSKAGVIQLTKHLAVHLAPDFLVNCVVPGGVFNDQPDSFLKKYSAKTPIGRMMRVEEIYGALDYLLHENSTYSTGSTIVLDGGWTAL